MEDSLRNRVVTLSSKKERVAADSLCLLVGKIQSGDMVLKAGKVLLVEKVLYYKKRKTFRFYCTDLLNVTDYRLSQFNFSIKDHLNLKVIHILK